MSFDVTRRGALMAAAGLGAMAAACSDRQEERFDPLPMPDGPFKHGVASGDPDRTSVVLWTAVTDADGPVLAELAADDDFEDIVWTGEAIPREGAIAVKGARPVKITVEGLEPGRGYAYRFRLGDQISTVGRTRTLPESGLDRFVIAAFSCANHPNGFFNAYRDAADRAEADLIVHLGDYLYEYGMGGYATEDAERLSRVPEPAHEIVSADDYARRHAQYCLDPDLQAARAAAPWVAIWDDHETANDSFVDGAENHQPETEGPWPARREAALRAYHDWMPTREGDDLAARYGAMEIGDLATVIFLETRLTARTGPPADLDVPLNADPDDPAVQAEVCRWREEVVGDPARELIGPEQLAFAGRTLAASVQAGKPWRVFANQVIMGRVDAPDYTAQTPFWLRWGMRMKGGEIWDYALRTRFGVPLTIDSWDGYPAERERLYAAARNANADFIVLTGDTHNGWCLDLKDAQGRRIGTEFGCTSVTSPSEFEFVNAPGVDFGRMTEDRNAEVLRHDAYAKGWLRLTLTREEAVCELMTVSTIKSREFSGGTESRWRVRPADGAEPGPVERIG